MKTFYQTLCTFLAICITISASAQVPKLNSYPSASGVVFLDFDGHYVDGTAWNYDGPIDCNTANMNAAQITEVFNRVAEDYRPFNVNITTDSAVYLAAPAYKRMRVVLTTSSSWYGSAGGVAYMNSFSWGDNTPCFVFTALHYYKTKNIAEASSHEIGHTLGLRHQSAYDAVCNKTSEYNAGVGGGEIAWAPIMGNGYYRNLTLWHYGSNPYGCNNLQDDLSIITGFSNGLGYRTDDHSNLAIEATTATLTNNQFTVNGIIERPADIDMIKINVPVKSQVKFSTLPYSVATGNTGANIDIQVEILNSTQTVVAVYNPEATLHAIVDTQLNAGVYYLRVQGKGNAYALEYASLGSYTISGMITAGNPLPVHKLQLKATTDNNKHKLDWEIIADETVVNQAVDVSADGVNFQPVSALNATQRTFSYLPSKNNVSYYRMNVMFDNGRRFYSNVAVLRSNGINSKPFMISNITTGQLSISSPSVFNYTIHDLNGRTLAKGLLTQGYNNISTGFISRGMYIIRYYDATEQYTEKFMKQ